MRFSLAVVLLFIIACHAAQVSVTDDADSSSSPSKSSQTEPKTSRTSSTKPTSVFTTKKKAAASKTTVTTITKAKATSASKSSIPSADKGAMFTLVKENSSTSESTDEPDSEEPSSTKTKSRNTNTQTAPVASSKATGDGVKKYGDGGDGLYNADDPRMDCNALQQSWSSFAGNEDCSDAGSLGSSIKLMVSMVLLGIAWTLM